MSTPAANALIEQFCQQHTLPNHYKSMAEHYFLPLAEDLANHCDNANSSLFIGINGSQGSGKSTLAAFLSAALEQQFHKHVCILSIDDFYHTRDTRQQLAQQIHPLLQTRGVPGTHDIELLEQTLNKLRQPNPQTVNIPRFNKATDDRHEPANWDTIETPIDIIILEGWCVGASPQTTSALKTPCNSLEKEEDSEGVWRNYVNQTIKNALGPIFSTIDYMVMLKAPSFDCVFKWRQLQEEKLKQSLPEDADQSGVMDDNALLRFIQHYQRITEHMLITLPSQADITFTLNPEHDVTARINNG